MTMNDLFNCLSTDAMERLLAKWDKQYGKMPSGKAIDALLEAIRDFAQDTEAMNELCAAIEAIWDAYAVPELDVVKFDYSAAEKKIRESAPAVKRNIKNYVFILGPIVKGTIKELIGK